MAARTARPAKPAPAAQIEETPVTVDTTPAPAPATPAPTICGCGCGSATVRPAARFIAGHDARLAGEIGRAMAEGKVSPEEAAARLGSDRLLAKATGIADTARRNLAAKAAREAAKAAAKAAYDAAMAAI